MTCPDPVRDIARAVLYEGYLLWPYTRSTAKNQQRFTFGGVHPAAFAQRYGDRSQLVMECLLEVPHDASPARVDVAVRYLHLVDRRPARREGDRLEPVDELLAGGERHLAWEEATEREVAVGPLSLEELRAGCTVPVAVAAGEDVEALGADGVLIRRWEALEGRLVVSGQPLDGNVHLLSVRFVNRCADAVIERAEALRRTFLSTHVVARATGAGFVSQTDPPEALRAEAKGCRNEGVWPVLVGEEGRRDTVLGSPIILSDHPSVAPESPGDLFDGGEIDALLIHNIRALTDAERDEMRATDPRVREILDRSIGLAPEEMLDLYGAVRDMRPLDS